ncbi:MAG: DUF1653 domain-containing protein [Nitrospiraceae bacterium]
MIRIGRYRHYKGKEYQVLGCAKHSETEEQFVVYRALYGDQGLWIRPTTMFLENVLVDGWSVPRFQFMDDDAGQKPRQR